MSIIESEFMGDVWPELRPGKADADYGSVSLAPTGDFEVRSLQTFTLVYIVGEYGLDDTGAIKIVHRWTDDGGNIQFDNPEDINHVTAIASNGVGLKLHAEPYPHQRPWYNGLRITVEKGFMAPGDTITVVYGDRSQGSPGYRLQTFCESAYEFKVLVDPCATGCFFPIDSPAIRIVAGQPEKWALVAPTLRRPGEIFSIGIRAEDGWGNATHQFKGKFNLSASTNVNGLPETLTCTNQDRAVIVENLNVNHESVVEFFLHDSDGSLLCKSNPLIIKQGEKSAYWGDLHGQSGETVGINPLKEYFEFARDIAFLEVTSHQANDFHVKSEFWQHINSLAKEFNVDEKFIVFPGYEWSGNTPVGGDHNVFYRHEGRPIYRSSHALLTDRSDIEDDAPTVKHLFSKLENEDSIVYAHVGGRPADIAYTDSPKLRTAVEVHSDWGTFEWIMTDAFRLGYRVGLVCNSDGHKGAPGANHPGASEFGAYSGLTCFLTDKLTRDSIFECLRRRHHYGTTGCRMHLDIKAQSDNGFKLYSRDPRYHDIEPEQTSEIMMGDIAALSNNWINFSINVHAHSPIERIDVLNGEKTIKTLRTFDKDDLGQRIRIIWQGAEYRGRGRQTNWLGHIKTKGIRINRMDKINAWNHERPFYLEKSDTIYFDTITTGNFVGCDLWLSNDEGLLKVDTTVVKDEFDLSEIKLNDLVLDVGGLDRKIRIFRLPEKIDQCSLTETIPVQLNNTGDNPIWVRVTTEDGFNAWSSPMYLYLE